MSNDDLFRAALSAFQSGDLERARISSEQLLAQSPGHGAAEHVLGLIHCRTGDIASGIAHLRRAFDIDPANPGFRVMLIRALVDSGNGREAFDLASAPQGPAQNNPMLWHARAEAADAVGDAKAAAEAWDRVAGLQPGDWRAWSNAGNAFARLEQWDKSAHALTQAARLNPEEHPIRRNLISALAQSGRMDEAAGEAEALLAIDPDDGAARMLWAKALWETGDHQVSLDQYDDPVARCLAASPDDPAGALLELGRLPIGKEHDGAAAFDADMLRAIATLLDRTNRSAELGAFLDAVLQEGFEEREFATAAAAAAFRDGDPVRARRLLESKEEEGDLVQHFRLLSRIEVALGHPAAAFAAAQRMNESFDDFEEQRRKGAEYRAKVRALRNSAEATIEAVTPLQPGTRRSPAFLVGFPRSGTTLLDTFLMGHPETAVVEEAPLLAAAERAIGRASRLAQCTPGELERARQAYFAELDRYLDPGFDGLVIDKMPLNMLGLPFIHAMFPDARVVFAQRHPCDCVLSCFMQSFVLSDAMANFLDIGDSADMYDACLDLFTFTRSKLPLAVDDIVYEQLVADPAASLRPLIDFLGLEWNDRLLDHQATAQKRGAIITPSYDQVVKPLTTGSSGRWRRYRDQLEPVLPLLLPWARRLGYADSE